MSRHLLVALKEETLEVLDVYAKQIKAMHGVEDVIPIFDDRAALPEAELDSIRLEYMMEENAALGKLLGEVDRLKNKEMLLLSGLKNNAEENARLKLESALLKQQLAQLGVREKN